jgi:hypothetical protein
MASYSLDVTLRLSACTGFRRVTRREEKKEKKKRKKERKDRKKSVASHPEE